MGWGVAECGSRSLCGCTWLLGAWLEGEGRVGMSGQSTEPHIHGDPGCPWLFQTEAGSTNCIYSTISVRPKEGLTVTKAGEPLSKKVRVENFTLSKN